LNGFKRTFLKKNLKGQERMSRSTERRGKRRKGTDLDTDTTTNTKFFRNGSDLVILGDLDTFTTCLVLEQKRKAKKKISEQAMWRRKAGGTNPFSQQDSSSCIPACISWVCIDQD
jgi:hypothetical protein